MSRVWLQRIALVALWAAAFAGWRWYASSEGLSTIETAQRFVDAVDSVWWGPIVFGIAYLLRPLLLFPASIMTIAAGLLFGAVAGTLVVIVVANASAMLAYLIGRGLAGDPKQPDDAERAGLIARWGQRMRTNSFESVFIMRLLFLPYDLVNYASGALRIRWTSFLLATVLGTLPGTVSFVLLGASVERLDEGLGGINPVTIVASVAIFVASIVIARIVKQRNAMADAETAPGPELVALDGAAS